MGALHSRHMSTAMVEEAFKKSGIVPDVLPVAPTHGMQIYYNEHKVDYGNHLTPTLVKNQPKVKWDYESKSLYTLAMTDPDAPSRKAPEFREWHHWLIINIPDNDISKGQVLSEYIGSGPPPDTGLHRYVFLVYKQPGNISDSEHGHLSNTSGDKRGNFKIARFADKHQLGNPVAGNYFEAEYDDYVPELYKQLGG